MDYDANGNLVVSAAQSLPGFRLPTYGPSAPAMGSGTSNFTGGDFVAGTGVPDAVANPGSMWDSFLQQRGANGASSGGWGSAALGVGQGLLGAYMGMQQYGLAKEQLKFSKDSFAKNWGAQQTATNNNITSMNTARAASREGASNPYQPLNLVA